MTDTPAHQGTPREVFAAFLPLGFTAFGGPVAHLGFFRTAFVERRGWLSDAAYADLVALCQFMPGPASSQVGMALGLRRAGLLGMVAAWTAFTLPSAIALAAFGLLLGVTGVEDGAGWLLGLKAAAVAVVANALLGMAGQLAATRTLATIAAVAAIAILTTPEGYRALAQVGVIVAGGLAGLVLATADTPERGEAAPATIPKGWAIACLAAFAILLVGLPLLAHLGAALDLLDRTYRAGALVFGGGHVVLPLLQNEMAGLVDESTFLAGYGAAQAVPGPLFTFAAFLGSVAKPFGGAAGAVVALIGIFLPSVLLVLGILPFWEDLRRLPALRKALAGVNAAVVGLLGAAFYDPVLVDGAPNGAAIALAIGAFILLRQWSVA
ncbi:MAG: chromate efflux transporter, partial [Pseudomonadota bacterium]